MKSKRKDKFLSTLIGHACRFSSNNMNNDMSHPIRLLTAGNNCIEQDEIFLVIEIIKEDNTIGVLLNNGQIDYLFDWSLPYIRKIT